MFQTATRLINATVALWVAMVCVALVASPLRLCDGGLLVSSADDVDPCDENDPVDEDQVEYGSITVRTRTRQDFRSQKSTIAFSLTGGCVSMPARQSSWAAVSAIPFPGRNGCGAILRC